MDEVESETSLEWALELGNPERALGTWNTEVIFFSLTDVIEFSIVTFNIFWWSLAWS